MEFGFYVDYLIFFIHNLKDIGSPIGVSQEKLKLTLESCLPYCTCVLFLTGMTFYQTGIYHTL